MQARPGVSRVPGAQLEAPQVMPDPDEDQVALANLDLLIPLGALSPVCVILCRAGSGLSAVARYSMGQARDTDRPSFTSPTAASVVAGVR